MVNSGVRGLLLEPCSCKVCSGNFSARKFLRRMGATQRLRRNAGGQRRSKNHGKLAAFALFCWNLVLSKVFVENFLRGNFCKAWAPRSVSSTRRGSKTSKNHGKFRDSRFDVGTLFSRGLFGKFSAWKFLQGMGATQRFKHEAGEQKRAKIMESSGIRGLMLELCSREVCSGKFRHGSFCKAWAPRSVSSTKRGSKNEQKSCQVLAFAVCCWNFVLARFVREIFRHESFCKAWAPRSVSSTKRGSKNEQKSYQVLAFVALAGANARKR